MHGAVRSVPLEPQGEGQQRGWASEAAENWQSWRKALRMGTAWERCLGPGWGHLAGPLKFFSKHVVRGDWLRKMQLPRGAGGLQATYVCPCWMGVRAQRDPSPLKELGPCQHWKNGQGEEK